MSIRSAFAYAALVLSLGALGCEDQAYVSPNTVSLSITDSDGIERVHRCNYIPILLGSEVKARYAVDDDLKAVIAITRDEITLTFEPPAGDPWVEESSQFQDKLSAPIRMKTPPSKHVVELDSFCKADSD